MSLNYKQKMLRPVINWLVETFFPNGCFYGYDYQEQFEELDDGVVTGYSCASYLIHTAIDQNATELSVEVNGLTIRGDDVGDWKVTIENIKRGDDFPKKIDSGISHVSDCLNMETGEREVKVKRNDST